MIMVSSCVVHLAADASYWSAVDAVHQLSMSHCHVSHSVPQSSAFNQSLFPACSYPVPFLALVRSWIVAFSCFSLKQVSQATCASYVVALATAKPVPHVACNQLQF